MAPLFVLPPTPAGSVNLQPSTARPRGCLVRFSTVRSRIIRSYTGENPSGSLDGQVLLLLLEKRQQQSQQHDSLQQYHRNTATESPYTVLVELECWLGQAGPDVRC